MLVKLKMNNVIKKKKKAIENGTLIIPNAKPTIKIEKVIQIVRLSLLVFAIIRETKTRQTPKAIIRIFRKIYSSPLKCILCFFRFYLYISRNLESKYIIKTSASSSYPSCK